MEKLDELIKVFSRLQGIGRKSAIRIAFDILSKDESEIQKMLDTIKSSYEAIKPCSICNTLTSDGICNVCSDDKRNKSIICIVENTKDVFAFEKAGGYNGLYHVLGSKLDPLNGIGVGSLNIDSLLSRLDNVSEIILALNPDIEGETTCMYLTKVLANKNLKISKIASGIPMGGNIEYTDMMTLVKSLEGRTEIKNE
ncbi:recombination mediator RecR [Oceanivirga miroungae]|uniref:Recombination protein RecR n=1 Tax=Oceanivirga miroungae TaxID=1130046 RepID=A0A6I8MEW6_9FUSO|nr:recombination mediator RecR [Oceanivirga miroungae]VWL85789.1 recombination protein RecR [Oceanivirga miroungae]